MSNGIKLAITLLIFTNLSCGVAYINQRQINQNQTIDVIRLHEEKKKLNKDNGRLLKVLNNYKATMTRVLPVLQLCKSVLSTKK